ncbi:FGGY-family carbohydrate kinase [Spirosoma radiotolerans]|uniref:Carbohydrate kinase n=1 Tax=Spirosoma radiotolerans TaxID=1379870 RepID=A0A0E3ZWJ8_9BACT|nr:FGGY family carbohydrate kinase [Spirosoma radiotolerans]AKD55745.1 carbohydrate kinase [Spirosoma radiotolerans]
MKQTPAIAVFDIGKTNKKLFLFDEYYRIVWEKSEQFVEITDNDGDACEDLDQLTNWITLSLTEVLALPDFSVQAVNFSTYGASLVLIDPAGKPLCPLYNYLKAYPPTLLQQFFRKYGPESEITRQTASPSLSSLNSGLQLYRFKYEQPDLFNRLGYALHLPQYASYLISQWPVSDLTSIGCHTMLWDFDRQVYHSWVGKEKLDTRLAPIVPSDSARLVTVNGNSIQVGVGLHDSSAALIPYLASFQEPFVLISTGTWCVSMNPFNSSPLTPEELQYDCLNYMHYKGQPVKSARLFAGYEHEHQVKRLADHFQVPIDAYVRVAYDPDLVEQLRQHVSQVTTEEDAKGKQLLSMQGSLFGQRDLADFATYEEAYHQLMLDIVAQQLISTNLVLADTSNNRVNVKRLFVDGGFGKNPIYMNLLAKAFPDIDVYAASVAQASALGAALAIHSYWNAQPLPSDCVDLKKYTTSVIA